MWLTLMKCVCVCVLLKANKRKRKRQLKTARRRCTSCIQNMCQNSVFFSLKFHLCGGCILFLCWNFIKKKSGFDFVFFRDSSFRWIPAFVFRLWCWWIHRNFSRQSRFWRSRFLIINWNLFITLCDFQFHTSHIPHARKKYSRSFWC